MTSGDLESVVHITKGECNGVGLAECAAYLAEVMPALLLQWHPAEYHSSRFFPSLPPLSQSIPSLLVPVREVFENKAQAHAHAQARGKHMLSWLMGRLDR